MRIASFLLHGVDADSSRTLLAQMEKMLGGGSNGEIEVRSDEPLSSLPDHAPSIILVALADAQELFDSVGEEGTLHLTLVLTGRRSIRAATRLESRLPFELVATRASAFEVGQALFSLERQLEIHLAQRRLKQRIAELQIELNESQQSVERLSRQIEPLTHNEGSGGSAQQEYSLRRIEESIDMAQRYGVPLSCLLVGLRQSDGQEVPDALLARIAGRLKRCVRSTDLLTLFGKDQFLVLSPFTSPKAAIALADRLFAQMTERELSQVEMRIGLSNFERPMKEPRDLMQKAEDALAEARATGHRMVSSSASTARRTKSGV